MQEMSIWTELVQECAINYTSSTCLPCQPNTFTLCNNADRKCTPCRTECPGNHRPDDEQRQFISEKCTSTSDIVCSCVHGYWKETRPHGECRTISTCSVGEGVAKLASIFSDTVCVPCVNGSTFSDFSSAKEACKNCTVCEKKETKYQPCLPRSNTICKPVSSTDNGVQSPSKTVNIGLIVGIVAGLAVFLGIAIGIAYCLKKKCCPRTPVTQFSRQATKMESHDNGIQILEFHWPATILSDEQLLKITATIGNGWEVLASALGLDKAAIFRIQHDNNLSVNTQVFQALIAWRNRVESPTLRSYKIMSCENMRNIVTIEWEKLNSLIEAIAGKTML